MMTAGALRTFGATLLQTSDLSRTDVELQGFRLRPAPMLNTLRPVL